MTVDPGGTTEDALLGGRIRLAQPASGYRAAIDPVLLAAAVDMAGGRVLDAGAGSGAASLCLAFRLGDCRIAALERNPEALDLLRRNIETNGFADRIEALPGDLAESGSAFGTGGFDVVMTNPPFLEPGRGTAPDPSRRPARVEGVLDLAAWLAACLRPLRPRGRLVLIHRADRLDAVLAALHGRAGDLEVHPLWPRADADRARRIVLRARKGARGPLRLARGVVLHEADGRFTTEADAMLREGGAFPS